MQNSPKLYELLIQMEEAADRESVLKINPPFIVEYNKVMPEHCDEGSLPNLYDMARNKLLNSVDDIVSTTSVEREDELRMARELISRIPKPE
jgi:hypothetical protein|tara:strand:+ start:840 stop:1115 length:276 start_codon:yes stop_codon:yes gene_type:complete